MPFEVHVGASDTLILAGHASGSSLVTLRGPVAEVNKVVDSFVYAPDAAFAGGQDNLTVTVRDMGGHGSGGPQTFVAELPVLVTGPPSSSNPCAASLPWAQISQIGAA